MAPAFTYYGLICPILPFRVAPPASSSLGSDPTHLGFIPSPTSKLPRDSIPSTRPFVPWTRPTATGPASVRVKLSIASVRSSLDRRCYLLARSYPPAPQFLLWRRSYRSNQPRSQQPGRSIAPEAAVTASGQRLRIFDLGRIHPAPLVPTRRRCSPVMDGFSALQLSVSRRSPTDPVDAR
ncbi:uncharacterized protein LOC123408612 [Hordeum vulgare subsp. vulgare]|uniref:uncharacterized protein LOC123408612 n=1 Tax=Hordeum vulgare subsp. vulgare TaxID=112509 RepID=UPI001D1A4902|nr:uncharacterized protein LOC123408612 [Hordeum vulgare subsp. vulgare]